MKKEERLRKLKMLNEFCQKSGLKENELEELFWNAKKIAQGASFDIYYDDGEITKRIDLNKTPLAYRYDDCCSKSIWLAAQTLENATRQEALAYMAKLPKISSHPWRILDYQEVGSLLNAMSRARNRVPFEVHTIQKFFDLPNFMDDFPDERDAKLGCVDYDNRVIAAYWYFPDSYWSGVEETVKLCWWPACDVD